MYVVVDINTAAAAAAAATGVSHTLEEVSRDRRKIAS
jgi:hypothetical protein